MAAAIEGEEDKVMAKAKEIVKSLNMSKADTKDMILILSSFDNRLSNISTLISSTTNASAPDTDPRLEEAEKIILRWDDADGGNSSSSATAASLWEDSPEEAAEYLAAVDKILDLTEDPSVPQNGPIMDRAEIALQSAMSRLEDEFRHILSRNAVPFSADRLYGSMRRASLSFASVDNDNDLESVCGEDDGGGSSSQQYGHERAVSVASLGDDVFLDLVHPDAVEVLKVIADRMIRSKYEKECCQVYSSVRRNVIDECLAILGVERHSIEEVQKVEWNALDEKMKRWVRAVKVVVRVLLTGEKRLCEQLFEGSELIREVSFAETAKGCVMQLLNFAEAVAISKRSPEKLFRILDMYDVLKDVLPDYELLFGEESGELVCGEAQGVLDALGEAALGTFVEFENAVKKEATKKPTQGGEIHPLTRYVMNYVKLLVDYSGSLNDLLGSNGSSEQDDCVDRENWNGLPLECTSPFAVRLLSLITSLESNLEEKSRVYDDSAMQYVFLMNNILYVVQKVKGSELGKLLGDQWVRKRRGQIRQYSTSYLRASWSKALACLKDEGIGGSSSNASKVALKERFKNFNACFEEIYRVQTAWKVPDAQLREELRISISEKVLPAYRAFLGRFGNHLESGKHAGRYIKYTPDDLETYLSDLFEGTPGLLHHMRRKST